MLNTGSYSNLNNHFLTIKQNKVMETKALKSNSKQVTNAIQKHILESVYDYQENNFSTIDEACKHVASEFKRVANHAYNIKRYPNVQLRFSDYLNGLPFHFEFENYKIEQFLNSLGLNPSSKKYDYEKSLSLYHYLIFKQVSKFI